MENKTPKFRLDDIAKIPEGIKEIIKEIAAEISQQKRLQPVRVKSNGILNEVCIPYTGQCATQSDHGLNYCDPYCGCSPQCSCDDKCNYCPCVDYDPCPDFEGCACYSDYPKDPCPSHCNFVGSDG